MLRSLRRTPYLCRSIRTTNRLWSSPSSPGGKQDVSAVNTSSISFGKETVGSALPFRCNTDFILTRVPRVHHPLLNHLANYSKPAKETVVENDKATDEKPKEPEEDLSSSRPKTLEDFQHEEITGPTVDRDTSPVADELRKAHEEMREAIRKFSKAILAVGAVHLVWGGMMFRVVDPPYSHSLLTQVCLSSFLLFGLSYYSRQTLKPIEFFSKLEERSRLRIITLSLQVTKTLSSFFQRGYGVNLVLLLAVIANLIGSMKVFLGF